jgi:hypothetical protein
MHDNLSIQGSPEKPGTQIPGDNDQIRKSFSYIPFTAKSLKSSSLEDSDSVQSSNQIYETTSVKFFSPCDEHAQKDVNLFSFTSAPVKKSVGKVSNFLASPSENSTNPLVLSQKKTEPSSLISDQIADDLGDSKQVKQSKDPTSSVDAVADESEEEDLSLGDENPEDAYGNTDAKETHYIEGKKQALDESQEGVFNEISGLTEELSGSTKEVSGAAKEVISSVISQSNLEKIEQLKETVVKAANDSAESEGVVYEQGFVKAIASKEVLSGYRTWYFQKIQKIRTITTHFTMFLSTAYVFFRLLLRIQPVQRILQIAMLH